jgi:hypothetical protein
MPAWYVLFQRSVLFMRRFCFCFFVCFLEGKQNDGICSCAKSPLWVSYRTTERPSHARVWGDVCELFTTPPLPKGRILEGGLTHSGCLWGGVAWVAIGGHEVRYGLNNEQLINRRLRMR